MKTLKRFGAIILALAMMFALSVTTFAAEANATLDDGVFESQTTDENSVLILKELVIHNTDGEEIYLPTVNYSYTIAEAAVTEGTTVTDSQGVVAVVYSDNIDNRALQTTQATVGFSPEFTDGYDSTGVSQMYTQPMEALSDGTAVFGGFTITFEPANFDHAGVFRYVIEESSDNRTAAGITTTTDDFKRFLDVYVRSTDTNNDGVYDSQVIYGYVLFKANESIDPVDTYSAGKTNGFVEGATITSVADQYYTKNLEVKKTFGTSPLNQTGHEFPFTVTITSGTNGLGAWLNAADTTGNKQQGFDATHVVLANNSILKADLSDGKTIELYGIPAEANVSVTVQEKNNTYDVYELTATVTNSKDNNGDDTDITNVNAPVAAQSDSEITNAINVNEEHKTVVTFNNNLTEVSPTGLVMRFAPYALILVAGIVLLIIALKRKSRKNDDD